MPWKGVTVSEQRQRFLEDYQLNYYSISELAERFCISRTTAYKWINRFKQFGQSGYHELSRRPHTCPWQTEKAIVGELVKARKAHPSWGPRKLLDLMNRRNPGRDLPSSSTAMRILSREGLVRPRRRHRRAHPGCPKSVPQGPNDIWAADYKGQFRLKNGNYCFPLTVSDLSSRFILGVDAHPAISLEKSFTHFRQVFETEPGKPQQNGVHERMHRTLKQDATIPPGSSLRGQQKKFDEFREEFNQVRPHEAIGMKRPGEIYQASEQTMPKQIETYDYPAHYLVRRVSRAGTIRVFHNQVFVSNTLHEDYVGLEEVDDGVYDLFFCFYQIGRYELQTNKIKGIVSKVGLSVKRADLVSRV
jgi:transposase InsO family protein